MSSAFDEILRILKEGKQSGCIYCGFSFVSSPEAMRFATREHLLPRAKTAKRRGSNCKNNTYLCCYKCNTIRRNRLPDGDIKRDIENPGKTLPNWLSEVNTASGKRYYLKTKKTRDKLIQEIRDTIIIPESLKLFEVWRQIFWNIDAERKKNERGA